MRTARISSLVAAMALIAPLTRVAMAQPPPAPPDPVAVRYDAAFFAQFSPRTALDMVRHTPGFVLDIAENDDRRGFEGNVGNVLIDGERPTAKGEAIAELLRGIPARRVLRIEIRRAADTAGDASGTRVIANVVLQAAPWQGAWGGGVELGNRYRPAPNGFMALAGRLGHTDIVLNASSYSLWRDLPGSRVLADDTGAPAAVRHVSSPRHYHEYAGGGQAVRRVAGGRLEATLKRSVNWYDDRTRLLTDGETSGASIEHVPYRQHERSTELGASYKRTCHGWDWTMLSLLTRRHFDSHVTSTQDAGPPASPLVRQTALRDTTELVARIVTARTRTKGSTQVGIEGVRNTIDGVSRLTLDLGDGAMDLSVPNARVHVVEDRSELFASESWRPSDRWALDGRLGVEVSNLRFRGDVARGVTLAFVKPSISLTRTFTNQTQIQARVLRTVGQLNFTDFVATTSLADRQWSSAHPDLRPESTWRVEASADFRLRVDTGVRVLVFYDRIGDVVDWTVWGDGEARVDARGNIGSGRSTGVTATHRSPLPGVPGLALTATITAQKARIVDPTTGESRIISGREPARLDLSLRQNLPRDAAIGAAYVFRAGSSAYRLREIDWRRESPQLDAFVELPLPRSLRLRLQASSVLAQPGLRRRTFFTPDRSSGVSGWEFIDSRPGQWWVATVSGLF